MVTNVCWLCPTGVLLLLTQVSQIFLGPHHTKTHRFLSTHSKGIPLSLPLPPTCTTVATWNLVNVHSTCPIHENTNRRTQRAWMKVCERGRADRKSMNFHIHMVCQQAQPVPTQFLGHFSLYSHHMSPCLLASPASRIQRQMTPYGEDTCFYIPYQNTLMDGPWPFFKQLFVVANQNIHIQL